MPRITQFTARPQQRQQLQGARLTGADLTRADTSLSRSLAGAAQQTEAFANVLVEREIKDDMSNASKIAMDTVTQWDAQRIERQSTAEPGAAGFADSMLADYDAFAEEQVNAASTDQGRQFLQQKLGQYRVQLSRQSNTFEAKSRVNHRRSEFLDTVNTTANQLVSSPELFRTQLDTINDGISASNLPPIEQQELKRRASNALGEATVKGLIAQNPSVAIDLVKRGDFDEYIDPDMKARLLTSANKGVSGRAQLAKSEARQALKLLDKGGIVAEDTIKSLQNQMAAAGEVDLANELGAAANIANFQLAFRGLPVDSIRDAQGNVVVQGMNDVMLELRADKDLKKSLAGLKKVETAEKILKEAQRGRNNPIETASSLGGVPIEPIRFAEDGSLDTAFLTQRKQHALLAAQLYSAPEPKFFSEPEIDQMVSNFERLGFNGKVSFLDNLSGNFNEEELLTVAAQFAPKDNGFAGALALASEQPTLASDVLLGQQVVAEKSIDIPTDISFTGSFSAAVGTAITNPIAAAQLREVSKFAYAAKQFKEGKSDKNISDDGYTDVLESLIGEKFTYNSQDTLPFKKPNGEWASRRDFSNTLRQTIENPQLLVESGNDLPRDLSTGEPVDLKQLWDQAQFQTLANGVYGVTVGGMALIDKDGRAYTFDMNELFKIIQPKVKQVTREERRSARTGR